MTKRNLVIGTVLVSSMVLTSGCAGKFMHGDFSNKIFSKYDKNDDGYVSKKEHFNIALERFKRCDDNDDGQISKEELEDSRISKMMPSFVDNYFKHNDHNNDGFVSKNEIIKQTKVNFEQSDKNKDKRLTKQEMKEFKAQRRFNSVDTNKDGSISMDEYKNQKSPFNK